MGEIKDLWRQHPWGPGWRVESGLEAPPAHTSGFRLFRWGGGDGGPPKGRRPYWRWFFIFLAGALGVAALAGVGFVWWLSRDLPDYSHLATYEPPVATRVYASDGTLIAEYAHERRLYVPVRVFPKQLIEAFLAAEDKHFYTHGGIDVEGIVRAMGSDFLNLLMGRRFVGASTITQQVAKNFLLTSEISITRKIKEAMLAIKLEHAYTKDQILELYLNEIYLGIGSYGVVSAALNYFDKPLNQLTLSEVAYLASLPKGPNNYNPFRFYERARARRNRVIDRMQEDGFITLAAAQEAKRTPLRVVTHKASPEIADAGYFVEQVRQKLVELYGEKKVYEGGLAVHTTLDLTLQSAAKNALFRGLVAYDRRHGWRGPFAKIPMDPKGA